LKKISEIHLDCGDFFSDGKWVKGCGHATGIGGAGAGQSMGNGNDWVSTDYLCGIGGGNGSGDGDCGGPKTLSRFGVAGSGTGRGSGCGRGNSVGFGAGEVQQTNEVVSFGIGNGDGETFEKEVMFTWSDF